MAAFLLIAEIPPVKVLSEFVNFLTYELIVKKRVNTGVTFYFVDFEANFFRTNFSLSATKSPWHLIQFLQLIIELGNSLHTL